MHFTAVKSLEHVLVWLIHILKILFKQYLVSSAQFSEACLNGALMKKERKNTQDK